MIDRSCADVNPHPPPYGGPPSPRWKDPLAGGSVYHGGRLAKIAFFDYKITQSKILRPFVVVGDGALDIPPHQHDFMKYRWSIFDR